MINHILIQPVGNIYMQCLTCHKLIASGVSVVNKMQLSLVISYLLISGYFLINWVRFSSRNPTSAPEDKFLSFLMSLMTTIFWPLVIPISCVEMIKNRKIELNTIVPIFLAIFALSLSYYLSFLQ
jgi:hypothetical protein